MEAPRASRSTSPGTRATTPTGAAARRPRTWGQPISLNPLAGCGTATPAPGLTGPDATGAFTMTSPTPLPTPPAANCPPAGGTACPAIANVGVVIEGHPGVVTTGPGATAIPVTSAVGYGNVAGGAPVARRMVVDIAKCDVCHNLLALHGTNRNDEHAGLRRLPQPGIHRCERAANTDRNDAGNRRPVGADDRLQAHDPRDP